MEMKVSFHSEIQDLTSQILHFCWINLRFLRKRIIVSFRSDVWDLEN